MKKYHYNIFQEKNDLEITKHKLAIEVDEKEHSDRPENEEKKQKIS